MGSIPEEFSILSIGRLIQSHYPTHFFLLLEGSISSRHCNYGISHVSEDEKA
jgi:hypothetical protein